MTHKLFRQPFFYSMMIRDIFRGYAALLSILIKTVFLLCICAGIAFIFVFPLWKFAVTFPDQYSLFIIYTCVIALVILLFFRLLNRIKLAGTAQQKKILLKTTIKNTLKCLVLLSGIISTFIFLYKEKLFFALTSIILMVLLYGILAFRTAKTQENSIKDSENIH